MRKFDELVLPGSCLSKAQENEMLFVLLGRDVAAPATIRFWVGERLRLGKNERTDDQIIEALEAARTMEMEAGSLKDKKKHPRGWVFVHEATGHEIGSAEPGLYENTDQARHGFGKAYAGDPFLVYFRDSEGDLCSCADESRPEDFD